MEASISLTNTLARVRVIVTQDRGVSPGLVADVSIGPDAFLVDEVGSQTKEGTLLLWLRDVRRDLVGGGGWCRVALSVVLRDSSHSCGRKNGEKRREVHFDGTSERR